MKAQTVKSILMDSLKRELMMTRSNDDQVRARRVQVVLDMVRNSKTENPTQARTMELTISGGSDDLV